MSDTISRAAAIDIVKKNTFRLTFAEEQNCEGRVAWSADAVYSDVIEGALLELPSAQPNLQPTCNQLATDCISRQDTQKRLCEDCPENAECVGLKYIECRNIADMPSAQPETAKRIVGKSRDGLILWYQCDMCNEPVGAQDNFCCGCGRRLTDG